MLIGFMRQPKTNPIRLPSCDTICDGRMLPSASRTITDRVSAGSASVASAMSSRSAATGL